MKQNLLSLALAATLFAAPLASLHGQEAILYEPTEMEDAMTNEQLYQGKTAPPALPAPREEGQVQTAPAPRTGVRAPYHAPMQGPASGRGYPSNQYSRHQTRYPAYANTQVWVPGHWRYSFRLYQYVWVAGRYATPPRPGMVFVPGHWRHTIRGWTWVNSHWRPARNRFAYGY